MSEKTSCDAALLSQRYGELREEFRDMERSLLAARDTTQALLSRLERVIGRGATIVESIEAALKAAEHHANERTDAFVLGCQPSAKDAASHHTDSKGTGVSS